jgi:hypothetical protein
MDGEKAGQCVIDRCGKRVLWRETIIRDKGGGGRAASDMSNKVPIRLGSAPVEPTSMQVKDRCIWQRINRLAPPAGKTTDCVLPKRDAWRGACVANDTVKCGAGRNPAQLSFVR